MLKLECSSCGAPLDSHKMQCPYCKTKYFRQDNQRIHDVQINIGGDISGSNICIGSNNIISTGGGAFIGGSINVKGDFIGGTKRKN